MDGLFDYNLDGIIDAADWGYVIVTRVGDGISSWGFGYVYYFESKGSYSSIGVSAVLGTGAPVIDIGGIGDNDGCADFGGTESLVTEQH